MFGKRVLTEEDEQRLFAEAEVRDSLTDKALAVRWNIPIRTLQDILDRQRRIKRESRTNYGSR